MVVIQHSQISFQPWMFPITVFISCEKAGSHTPCQPGACHTHTHTQTHTHTHTHTQKHTHTPTHTPTPPTHTQTQKKHSFSSSHTPMQARMYSPCSHSHIFDSKIIDL